MKQQHVPTTGQQARAYSADSHAALKAIDMGNVGAMNQDFFLHHAS